CAVSDERNRFHESWLCSSAGSARSPVVRVGWALSDAHWNVLRTSEVTQPSALPHGSYPLVIVDPGSSGPPHHGWLVQRVPVSAQPVTHTSHRNARHDQAHVSYSQIVAPSTCLPTMAEVFQRMKERAVVAVPS